MIQFVCGYIGKHVGLLHPTLVHQGTDARVSTTMVAVNHLRWEKDVQSAFITNCLRIMQHE